MVIDTSAIFAAISGEGDGALYRRAVKEAPVSFISAVTLLEAKIVLFARLGPDAVAALGDLLEEAAITVVPFDEEQAEAALAAFRRFGKGQGHRAQLNILDCAAYALSHLRGLPLLFKGGDFALTDLVPALPRGN